VLILDFAYEEKTIESIHQNLGLYKP
jgi:hypothetical protein